ncbi:two-component system response regulator BtsR [Thaumasiovibrio subtropicus]|uniref:two-component system response regulator BtsR n=1 Tax=Thaumasiovibrio subtropicus TaxID=1891207 RepID=UPI000B34B780|nr:two-component system response regulator BtsR [Thaumasiovibrio subtropicus]
MITALVVDDELFAREELIELLEEAGDIEIIGQCSNAIEALKKIHQDKPDVVFLDIQMPQITGIELLSMMDQDTMPKIVFVTAYDEYAIQAFEENAFDYLLKPLEEHRLRKTLEKLKRSTAQDVTPLTQETLEQIPCSGHNRILIVPTHEIEFVSSSLSGVTVYTAEQQATTQLTLKTLEDKTPLFRCHRQYLVNPKQIREVRLLENGLAEVITPSNHQIPISRRYLKPLKDLLGLHY